MSAPEQWRFQWPDGTWIRWNPDTEAWEKEIADAAGDEPRAEALDIAPEERWLFDNMEPPAPSAATAEEPAPEAGAEIISAETYDDEADWDDVAEEEGEEDVALGPRRSAAHVISTEAEEPRSSLRSTIIAGAGIGLAVGIVVTMMLR
ncbi:MAG: hypothetical protein ACRDKT_10810 [Actinomycetota bacterium]